MSGQPGRLLSVERRLIADVLLRPTPVITDAGAAGRMSPTVPPDTADQMVGLILSRVYSQRTRAMAAAVVTDDCLRYLLHLSRSPRSAPPQSGAGD
jgi:hypothetical protein